MATYLDETGLSTLWGKIKAKFLPLTGGTLTGSLTTNNGSNYTHLGVDRVVSDKTHQFRVYPHASNNSIYLDYLIDGTSQTTLCIGQGQLWTNGNMVYKLTSSNHYTYYYNTDNQHIATIRYNDNDSYHRFAFGHVDPSTGKYEGYVLPPRSESVSANTTYSILTSKTITASDTELNYCDGVTSNIQTQLNGKVPTSRTINSKALSSNITLAASDVGAVPTTRTINSKALSSNISLTASDVGAVPTTRTINSKALSSNITLAAADVGAVPTTRTVNGKALSANITLSASDVSALPISGGTLTGKLTLLGSQYSYYTDATKYALDCNNSDIIGVNALYTADQAGYYSEGFLFYEDGTVWDGFTAKNGTFYFGKNIKEGNVTLRGSAGIYCGNMRCEDGVNNSAYVNVHVNTVGTADTNGVGRLVLGNSTASGTAGNAYGRISIYDPAGKYYHLQTGTISSSKTKYFNKIPEVTWTSSTSTLAITV